MTDIQHARFRIDEVIHAPVRFSIVAALAQADEAEFAAVRDGHVRVAGQQWACLLYTSRCV